MGDVIHAVGVRDGQKGAKWKESKGWGVSEVPFVLRKNENLYFLARAQRKLPSLDQYDPTGPVVFWKLLLKDASYDT